MEVGASHCLAPIGREGFRASPYLQDIGCFVGQQLPFDEASHTLERVGRIVLSDKQIERLCHAYGEVLEDELYEDEVRTGTDQLHYVEVDGSMLLTRAEEALDLEGGWKEGKLGRIFSASDIVSIKKRSWIRQSDYVFHLGDHHAFEQKLSTRLSGKRNLVGVGDGARWIWDYFDREHPGAVQILDYFHVVEKLGAWARSFWAQANSCQAWMQRAETLLRSDGVDSLLKEIESTDCQGDSAKLKTSLVTYLTNNSSRMQYGTYLSKGYLIGSGAIESANRDVVQSRLKRSGQRWTQAGVQQVGNLRVAYKSDRWQLVREGIRNAA